jgi:CarD family transcriptional regulator
MEYHVGDKVVHPHHGPGRITGLEEKEFLDEAKHYFIIEIPGRELIIYVPKRKMDEVGIRPAMAEAKLQRVLEVLRGTPNALSEDYKERQADVEEKIVTGRPLLIAEAIRDLTWYGRNARLTKKDSEYLRQGQEFLAAEMALVSDREVADMHASIDAALTDAMGGS